MASGRPWSDRTVTGRPPRRKAMLARFRALIFCCALGAAYGATVGGGIGLFLTIPVNGVGFIIGLILGALGGAIGGLIGWTARGTHGWGLGGLVGGALDVCGRWI